MISLSVQNSISVALRRRTSLHESKPLKASARSCGPQSAMREEDRPKVAELSLYLNEDKCAVCKRQKRRAYHLQRYVVATKWQAAAFCEQHHSLKQKDALLAATVLLHGRAYHCDTPLSIGKWMSFLNMHIVYVESSGPGAYIRGL